MNKKQQMLLELKRKQIRDNERLKPKRQMAAESSQ